MKKAMISIATLLLLGGCTQTDLPPGGSVASNGPTPLQVDNIVLETATATRAATTTTLETDGVQIGIFRTKGTNYDAAQNNVPYTYTASGTPGWAPSDATKPVWLLGYPANVCAYYPYNAATTYNNSAAIPLATALYTLAGDICFDGNRQMTGQSVAENPTVNRRTAFAMKRAMAKMQITLKRGTYPGTCTVSQITLANTNLPKTGTINITSATNTASTSTKTSFAYSPTSSGDVSLNADGTLVDTPEVLLIPFTPSGNVNITLTVDGKDMTLSLPAAAFSATGNKIQAGKFYKLTLLLNSTALLVSSVTTEDWIDVPKSHGSNTEITPDEDYKPQPLGINVPKDQITLGGTTCTDSDKEALSKLRWAEGNLVTIGGLTDWATNTWDYGYYYQFNKFFDGTAGDPCTQLDPDNYGSGWRTPSSDELTALSRCTNKSLVSYNGKKGMWFMAPAPDGLFLPAASYRPGGSGDSGNAGVGLYGDYWSTTPYGSYHGYTLHYNSSSFTINASLASDGHSVRCVKFE